MGYCINFNTINSTAPHPPPPLSLFGCGLTSIFYSLKIEQNIHSWRLPWNMGSPRKSFVKIRASPPKNSILFYSTLKKSSIHKLKLYMYPWRIPLVLIWVGGRGVGAGCRYAIAQNRLCKSQTYNNFYIWSIYHENKKATTATNMLLLISY